MTIVNLFGRKLGLRSYMELATPSTGSFHAEIDRDHFDHVSRMMYLTPFVFNDGMKIDFRSPDEDLTGVLEDCRQAGHTMDICLVDGWHTYQNVRRDLAQMFDLLNDGGILVVHDCLPPSREGATPRFQFGAWWGTTYKAFLDFVLQTPALDYFTVDCDHGCGVIIKNRSFASVLGQDASPGWLPDRPDHDLVTRWLDAGTDFDRAYAFFDAQRAPLLRLVPEDRFLAMFRDESLALEQRPEKPPAKAPTARPAKSIDDWLLRMLRRKLARLVGRN